MPAIPMFTTEIYGDLYWVQPEDILLNDYSFNETFIGRYWLADSDPLVRGEWRFQTIMPREYSVNDAYMIITERIKGYLRNQYVTKFKEKYTKVRI